ncbi:DNA-3-methyladenine glycosylase family protein [Amycolatopsis pigmentata]|uniref:DNA-3-methyladenine glycosylase II n=1 Tax=Amycolatopsis pigmentata TaxID=450801 RepID=A0ABW5FZ71_9PSEU
MTITVQPRLTTAELVARGPFDLDASARFLAAFTPAARPGAAAEEGVLRMAFPVEGSWEHAGALIRRRTPGPDVGSGAPVEVSVQGAGSSADVAIGQVRRILSLDVDGSGFEDVARGDPVVGALARRYPGLRPVQFHSPYEAACWTIVGNGRPMSQAARIKQRIAERHGVEVDVAGVPLASFPAPEVLAVLDGELGLPVQKVERLHAVARAARDGLLDAGWLRSLEPDEALERLQRLPGVGPFSAQLILIRGAGHPDVFPLDEPRVHERMREAYRLPEATPAELDRLARRWRPYRSWVAVLLRARHA